MDPEALRQWLAPRAEQIMTFMDYEATFGSEAELAELLGESWFREPDWNPAGYRFIDLGMDGTGGQVALWVRPDHTRPPPIVFFGSEGGSGVLAPNALSWTQVIAHAPAIEEYPGALDAPSCLSTDGNWMLDDDDPTRAEQARVALAEYRSSVAERFGDVPAFETLAAVDPADVREFRTWVTGVQERVEARDAAATERAAAEERATRRAKAASFANRSADDVAHYSGEPKDGVSLQGTCPACGTKGDLRLTLYEELTFAICYECYFSDAW